MENEKRLWHNFEQNAQKKPVEICIFKKPVYINTPSARVDDSEKDSVVAQW